MAKMGGRETGQLTNWPIVNGWELMAEGMGMGWDGIVVYAGDASTLYSPAPKVEAWPPGKNE